jgi:hypothetical protein
MGPVANFFKPSKPKVPEPVKVPTRENSAADIAAAAEEDKQRRAAQAGRASTLLSGRGVVGDDTTGLATKKLLGGN